jgi:hypothetical protein
MLDRERAASARASGDDVMRALVIYESMFGNTLEVARAVADGIAPALEPDIIDAADAPVEIGSDVALIVLGGPTHAHGMSTPASRADSARRAGDRLVSRGNGMREWLDAVRPVATPVAAAVFDTRIKGPGFLWGSAAKPAAKRLASLGFQMVVEPEDFIVGGPTGPQFDRLEPGEVERARAWGADVARRVGVPAGTR